MDQKSPQKSSRWLTTLILVALVGVSIFVFFFVITTTWIGYEVKFQCKSAILEYGGSCREALINVLDDQNRPCRERNKAIWTLGQLGEKEALPALQAYYTGQIPDKEPLDAGLSQYELQKAIKLLESNFNLGAFVWRRNME